MPYARSRGFKIHYRIEGDGQPLVLYHWSLAYLEVWEELGYVDKLKSKYRLILVDALGHGKSDTPQGAAHYTLQMRVEDLITVLDAENIPESHYYGFSMGGWVGYGLALFAPERFKSIIIGGAHCFEQSMQGLRDLLISGIENGIDSFVREYESIFGKQTPTQKKIIRKFDLQALLDVAQDRESLEAHFPKMPGDKMLFLAGEEDSTLEGVKKCHQQLPGSTLVTFPGLTHGGLCGSTDLVVSHIDRFIADRPIS